MRRYLLFIYSILCIIKCIFSTYKLCDRAQYNILTVFGNSIFYFDCAVALNKLSTPTFSSTLSRIESATQPNLPATHIQRILFSLYAMYSS